MSEDREVLEQEGWEDLLDPDESSDEFEGWGDFLDSDDPSDEETYQSADSSNEEVYESDDTSDEFEDWEASFDPDEPISEEAYQPEALSDEEAYQSADSSNEEVYEAADTSREEAYQSDESSDEFEDWGDFLDSDDPSDEETYQSESPDNEETYEVEIAYESAGTSNEEVCQPEAPSNEGYSHTPENHSSSNSEDDPAQYLDKLEKIGIILSDFISLDSKIYDELCMAFTDMFKKHGADVNNRLISKAIDVFSQVVFCGVGIDTKPFAVDRGKYPKNNKILCKDLEVLVSGIYLSHSGTRGPDHYSNALRYSMLIHLEDGLRINEYLQTRRYLQDIDLLYSLIVNPGVAEEWNERVLQDIIDDSPNLPASRGQCENKVNAMIECLGLMYSSTFDLHPYPGVFLFGGMDKKDLSGKTYVSCQDVIFDPGRGEEVFRPVFDNVVTADMYQSLANAIQGYPEFRENHIEYERAYNLDEIISGHKYYPFACFSYATGSVLETENYYPSQEDIVYRRSKATSWSEYVSGVSGEVGLRERLTRLLSRYIYKALEHYGKNGFKFTDEDFKRIYNQEGAAKAYAIYTQGIAPQIASAVNNFVRSVCTACVLSRNDDDIVFKVKICTFEKHITKSSTKHLFDSVYFTQNSQGVSFPDANVIEVKSVNCTIYEFSFCRQQELMDKKPLFGYEAARLFQYQHRRISYDNILIGEDENGSPLFSNQGGIINIQGHVAHRISAGSRSGKGVMTMNILASSAASGAAIFYIDRKPDIGSELAYITDGNMFLVNGGDLQSGEDTRKCFIENDGSYGFMLQGYKAKGKGSFKYPYLTEVFGSGFGDAWAGAFGDFIYMKAVIFCLSLIAARMYFISNPPSAECRDALGIDRNVIVVIDEITNWHHWFESKYFPSDPYDQERTMAGVLHKFYSSTLGKASAGDDESSVIRDKLKKDAKAMLPEYEARYEQAKANLEAAEGADRDKAMKAVNSAKSALDKALKEAGVGEKDLDKKLYWSTFFDKYASSLDIVASIKNAGIKPEHTSMNDVFMIGQFISGVSNMRTNEPIAYTSDGKIAKQGTLEAEEYPLRNPGVATEDLDRSYMLGFAELVGCDWFTGRNLTNKDDVYSPRYPNFGGSRLGEKNPGLDNWLHTRGNWIYIPDGSQKDFRQGMPDISKVVKFKPYLVLNANDEPSGGDEIYTESYRKEHKVSTSVYKYVYGAADRVGIRSWKEIRKKHLKRNHKPPAYGQLEDGIGLRGLIKEYMYTDPAKAGCSFDKNCLSDSKVMADRICQRFGYEGYMDYLLDLSPRGIIGAQDIIDAYEVEGYAENENVRLPRMFPRYFNTGNQGLLSSSSDTPVASDESKKSFDFEVKGEEKPVSSPRKEEAPQPLAQTAHPNNPASNIDLSITWDTEFRLKIATSLADYALKVVNRTGDAELRQLCIDRAYKGLLDRGC